MHPDPTAVRPVPLIVEALPVAAAIGIFGVIYGATATTVLSPQMTVAGSVLLFSGAAQFAIVGLLEAGAGAGAVLVAVALLGLRHLPLAAVLLPRVRADRRHRSLLSLVLIDETVGLAVASARPPARTLVVVGAAAYVAWVGGTLAGVLGADVLGAAGLAEVVFTILFVGLAGLTCRSSADVRRALATAGAAAALLLIWPAVGAIGVMLVAVAAAMTTPRASGGFGR